MKVNGFYGMKIVIPPSISRVCADDIERTVVQLPNSVVIGRFITAYVHHGGATNISRDQKKCQAVSVPGWAGGLIDEEKVNGYFRETSRSPSCFLQSSGTGMASRSHLTTA
jgi:hypothetical protein